MRSLSRVRRLVGDDGLRRLQGARVVIFGVGGVGGFAAEALARAGIGRLSLVDFDVVCPTNINRQLPALYSTVGRAKVAVLAERFHDINPTMLVEPHAARYTLTEGPSLLEGEVDYVIDAIDSVAEKCHLIATCKALGLPLVSSMGAGGRLDPTRVRVTDLTQTHDDRLGAVLRRRLRRDHGFPGNRRWHIPAVFSDERAQLPDPVVLAEEGGEAVRGTFATVTGAFGLAAASVVLRGLLNAT
ncbi:tRNA threonylcarbamoyladenosine dehydratase [Myxococcota bacterium]|nr:tRNA threonylcarbamoyladenosine dehydratase [Myxococcota bacterium]MBU1431252.1 tRNA threonylcarbamoyladenosine dehydratase [Myxococcota bacterium]MBU1898059.1 tRNA threonylcarbamoyladenosine dehydratase [Myxococcota bacterium]